MTEESLNHLISGLVRGVMKNVEHINRQVMDNLSHLHDMDFMDNLSGKIDIDCDLSELEDLGERIEEMVAGAMECVHSSIGHVFHHFDDMDDLDDLDDL